MHHKWLLKLSLSVYFLFLQILSYLLDLPENEKEATEYAQMNNYDTLWGETGEWTNPIALQ